MPILDTRTIVKSFPYITEVKLQKEIIDHGEIRTFADGEVIMDFGQYIRSVPLLMKGSIKVIREDDKGNEILLYFLKPGETCTMSLTCCMADRKSQIRAVAEDESELLLIPVKKMEDWMAQYGSWKNFVMDSYGKRFEELLSTIDAIAFKKMDERLLDYLQKKSAAAGTNTLHITHQQIAAELNASREAISRLLKQLENQNIISLGRNRIDISHTM
ncbi:MAG: Crp/Fnr family transcriptional regulator [Bacteroidota bacterium]